MKHFTNQKLLGGIIGLTLTSCGARTMPSANVKATQPPVKEYLTCDVPGNYPRQCHLSDTTSQIAPPADVEMTTTITYNFTCIQYPNEVEAGSIYLQIREPDAQIRLIYGQTDGRIVVNSTQPITLADAEPATTLATHFLYSPPMCHLTMSYTQRPSINTVNLLGEHSKRLTADITRNMELYDAGRRLNRFISNDAEDLGPIIERFRNSDDIVLREEVAPKLQAYVDATLHGTDPDLSSLVTIINSKNLLIAELAEASLVLEKLRSYQIQFDELFVTQMEKAKTMLNGPILHPTAHDESIFSR